MARTLSRPRPALAGACALAMVMLSAAAAGAAGDPLSTHQWALDELGAPAAWATSTGSGVTIGIVDTGVDVTHPDLAGRVVAVADCVGGVCREGVAPDGDGHGTAVAALIAAPMGDGVGIAGVAPDVRLVVARALDDQGVGDTLDINNAIRWVVDQGADVVNLSLGPADRVFASIAGSTLRAGITYAWSRGAIPVLAAGNYDDEAGGTDSFNYGDLDAVVVGATDRDGNVSRFSVSLGDAKWGVVAPGGSGAGSGADVLAPTRDHDYAWQAGTSMAAPHVSGTLALLLAQGLSASQAVDVLLASLDSDRPCGVGCQGHVRADAAVAAAVDALAVPDQPGSAVGAATIDTPARPLSDQGSRTYVVGIAVLMVVVTASGWVVTVVRSA